MISETAEYTKVISLVITHDPPLKCQSLSYRCSNKTSLVLTCALCQNQQVWELWNWAAFGTVALEQHYVILCQEMVHSHLPVGQQYSVSKILSWLQTYFMRRVSSVWMRHYILWDKNEQGILSKYVKQAQGPENLRQTSPPENRNTWVFSCVRFDVARITQ